LQLFLYRFQKFLMYILQKFQKLMSYLS
jgi:hypothetical protein